ncbi:MAG TPA: hypothetical protein VL966_00035 [Alphaproteobacteria bacterium]|nr:hypothetical protein [Alphaproteobacteria bacterium]
MSTFQDSSPSAESPSRPSRPRVVLTLLAWGEQYADRLLALTLPAVLAPGNFPALAEAFECEVAIATQRNLIAHFDESERIRQLRQYGRVRYVEIDDLLIGSGSYGLTLSLSFFRVMQSFGAEMTDIHFLFLNADFILADESYRSLIPVLRSGANVVCSPSYCAIEEVVRPVLDDRIALGGGTLQMAKRDMAELILRHSHSTIRGQIVNGPFHYDHVYIYQGYVRADPHTLVGYQMPIAVVALKPTKNATALETFWDWGVVSELCEGGKEIVLGDSDDFLMLELRTTATGKDQIRLGGLTPEYVAHRLKNQLTRDQLHFGAYTLTLHSRDLGPPAEAARAQLDTFREKLRTLLPRDPAPHRNHPSWAYHYKLYQQKDKGIEPETYVAATEAPGAGGGGLRRRARRWLLGSAPDLSLIHPLRPAFRRLVLHLGPLLSGDARVLIVSNMPTSGIQEYIRKRAPYVVRVSVADAQKRLAVSCRDFDLCFFETEINHLRELPAIFTSIRPVMNPGGRVLAFAVNDLGDELRGDDDALITIAAEIDAPVTVHYGDAAAMWPALRAYTNARSMIGRSRILGGMLLMLSSIFWIPLAVLVNSGRAVHPARPNEFHRQCSDLTVEIDVAAAAE